MRTRLNSLKRLPEQNEPFSNGDSLIEIDEQLTPFLPAEKRFDYLLSLSGEIFRQVKNRRTLKVRIGPDPFFIKIHLGCGWGEIFKNLFRFQFPVVSASNEWLAAEQLRKLGVSVPRIFGKGQRGRNPAALESFVLMESLEGMISLEDLVTQLPSGKKGIQLKRQLIRSIAVIAKLVHENGMNHRDFYLCHFLVRDRDWSRWKDGESLELYLIDLHRVQIRTTVPTRWLIKDLGGLLFSAFDCGLTSSDLIRFLRIYQPGYQQILREKNGIWRKVFKTGRTLYQGYHRRPVPGLSLSK
jgi:heptose I phosphotransferase